MASIEFHSKQLELMIKANCKLIQMVSYEQLRVVACINQVANNLDMEWYTWSHIKALRKWNADEKQYVLEETEGLKDPMQLLTHIEEKIDNAIVVLEDFHPFYNDQNPEIVRYLREFATGSGNVAIVLLQPMRQIPIELSKDMSIIEMGLPGKEDLRVIAEQVVQDMELIDYEITDRVVEAALGLTIMEASSAFKKAVLIKNNLSESEIPIIIEEKEAVIKKDGLLEYYHPKNDMNSIGGLEELKEWIQKRGNAFEKSAREYGLALPKGVLLLGVPGCGKSLTAKVIAKTWNFPLLRFDLGKVFGGIVGESERNIRQALDVAKTIAPCVLWIDEIEKGLSGVNSSGSTDGGTTSRVFGTLLTWMQEKEEPVFVVATANDISVLPPELMRKGRFDEIFFVDLPTEQERVNILKIHLERKEREPEDFDLLKIARATVGFSGSELEELINEALYNSFDNGRELTDSDLIECISKVCPISKTMAETINSLRKWAKVRARIASNHQPEEVNVEKGMPRLPQEARNPFMA